MLSLTAQQRRRLCTCGSRQLAWRPAMETRCCHCLRLPNDCQCPATSDPAEGCLALDLANVREREGDDPGSERATDARSTPARTAGTTDSSTPRSGTATTAFGSARWSSQRGRACAACYALRTVASGTSMVGSTLRKPQAGCSGPVPAQLGPFPRAASGPSARPGRAPQWRASQSPSTPAASPRRGLPRSADDERWRRRVRGGCSLCAACRAGAGGGP